MRTLHFRKDNTLTVALWDPEKWTQLSQTQTANQGKSEIKSCTVLTAELWELIMQQEKINRATEEVLIML